MRKRLASLIGSNTVVLTAIVAIAGLSFGALGFVERDDAGQAVNTGLPREASAMSFLPATFQPVCPTPTAGSVTGETGSIKGTPLTNLVDAYTGVSGVSFQHQLFSTLSSATGSCAHFRNNEIVASENWLIPNQIAWNPDNQTNAPFATGTYTIGSETIGADGITHYSAAATFIPHGKSCSSGGQVDASAGSITYTTVNDTLVAGSYDLYFNSDHVTGTFSAPVCTLCAARPSRSSCVKQ